MSDTKTAWKEITKTEPGMRKVLVTNNLLARTSTGQMSHVWLVGGVHVCDPSDWRGPFMAFDESSLAKCSLTHYAEIPS